MARSAGISSDPQIRSYRRLREDEKAVCSSWSRHAAKCRYCCNPSDVWRRNGQLCDRGRMYAIDVAKYIYSKGGRPHSVIDKAAYGQRNEIEIPVEYEAVRELVRAFDKGLTLSAKKPIVSQDPHYYVKARDARYYNVDITPSSRRERERHHDDSNRRKTVHFSDDTYRGSLFYADEQAKRDRRRYEDEPVIVLAEPRRSSKYYQ